MTKLEAVAKQYKKALDRLGEVLSVAKSDITRDSAIQRFEFSHDLSWKLIKVILEEKKGILCFSPKDCFREAFRQGIIDYDDLWLELVDMRNLTVHTYQEKIAEEIYQILPQALKLFRQLASKIEKEPN